MTYNVGDRVRLTDATEFEYDRDPFFAAFGAPSIGDEGVVTHIGSETPGAPVDAMYVRFDDLAENGSYGVVPSEIELVADQVAA